MKRISLLILIGLILTFKLEARKIEGKILFENDTIDVTFKIPIRFFIQEPKYEKLQKRVKYYDSTGVKIILKPEHAKEIQFKYENESIRMISRYKSIGLGGNIFLRVENDGRLKLFNYYFIKKPGFYNPSTGTMTCWYLKQEMRYILQKGDEELKRFKKLNFKKDMAEYFSDCPALVEKIESKHFRIHDLDFIVQFYNSNCNSTISLSPLEDNR